MNIELDPICWTFAFAIAATVGWIGSAVWYGRKLKKIHKKEWAAARAFYEGRASSLKTGN